MIPALEETIKACLGNQEFMFHYRRLRSHAPGKDAPINWMVDEATGKFETEAMELFEFITTWIWMPVLAKMADEGGQHAD